MTHTNSSNSSSSTKQYMECHVNDDVDDEIARIKSQWHNLFGHALVQTLKHIIGLVALLFTLMRHWIPSQAKYGRSTHFYDCYVYIYYMRMDVCDTLCNCASIRYITRTNRFVALLRIGFLQNRAQHTKSS